MEQVITTIVVAIEMQIIFLELIPKDPLLKLGADFNEEIHETQTIPRPTAIMVETIITLKVNKLLIRKFQIHL